MSEELYIGDVPNDEESVQVTNEYDYIPAMRAEARAYVNQLTRKFPGLLFVARKEQHDFGPYYSVYLLYLDNTTLPDGLEEVDHWDDEARAELQSSTRWVAYQEWYKKHNATKAMTAAAESLYDADPECQHNIVDSSGGGVRCTKCGGWFCY